MCTRPTAAADGPVEGGHLRVSEVVGVAEYLMADVRLGGVQGAGVVAQILGAPEHPIREGRVETAQRSQPGHRLVAKAGLGAKSVGHLAELGHLPGGQPQRFDGVDDTPGRSSPPQRS